jgi:hypothetical protein
LSGGRTTLSAGILLNSSLKKAVFCRRFSTIPGNFLNRKRAITDWASVSLQFVPKDSCRNLYPGSRKVTTPG